MSAEPRLPMPTPRFPNLFAIFLGALLWPGIVQAEPSALEVARRVQRFYDATKTYQATFKQSYRIKVQNVKKVSTGRVTFAKPGKISFRYDKPNGNRVVSDGRIIKVYERNNRQMVRAKVRASQYPAALAFLMGKGKLVRDFKLRLLSSARMKVENGYLLEGVPKDATPAYQKLLMYIDGRTAQVRRVLVLDAQGNRNRFDFSAPKLNQKVPAGEFKFTPPRGTTIVKP
jgi:outer membrane lipoprotein carrier protein